MLPWQYENSQECRDAMVCTLLFIHANVVSLDPYGLCRSQLVAACLGFLFPTRGEYWSIYTVLGLLDP